MPANKHADTRGLAEIRARLLATDADTETVEPEAPMGPPPGPPPTRAEWASVCNRLSRVEAALRSVLRTTGT